MRLLSHIEVDTKIVEVIKQQHICKKKKFAIGNIITEWMKNIVGMRQVRVMSPTPFTMFMKELPVEIRKSGKRANIRVGNGILGCLAHACNVVLMAENN